VKLKRVRCQINGKGGDGQDEGGKGRPSGVNSIKKSKASAGKVQGFDVKINPDERKSQSIRLGDEGLPGTKKVRPQGVK